MRLKRFSYKARLEIDYRIIASSHYNCVSTLHRLKDSYAYGPFICLQPQPSQKCTRLSLLLFLLPIRQVDACPFYLQGKGGGGTIMTTDKRAWASSNLFPLHPPHIQNFRYVQFQFHIYKRSFSWLLYCFLRYHII
jgi:hypothetical protein